MRVTADLLADHVLDASRAEPAARELGPSAVSRIYDQNAEFVWASLQRMGVRAPDLEDVLQEVFVVVQKRLDTFDGTAKMTTWLFGICLRVAASYRRRGFRRRETCVGELPEIADAAASPEEDAARAQSRQRLDALLDELDPDKRAVFVMFEIEEMPCESIADVIGAPIGTVHSRLHAARKSFQKALARMHAREARRRWP